MATFPTGTGGLLLAVGTYDLAKARASLEARVAVPATTTAAFAGPSLETLNEKPRSARLELHGSPPTPTP